MPLTATQRYPCVAEGPDDFLEVRSTPGNLFVRMSVEEMRHVPVVEDFVLLSPIDVRRLRDQLTEFLDAID